MKMNIEFETGTPKNIMMNDLTVFTGTDLLWEVDLSSRLAKAKGNIEGTWLPPIETNNDICDLSVFEDTDISKNPELTDHLSSVIDGSYVYNHDEDGTWSFHMKTGQNIWLEASGIPNFICNLRPLYLYLKFILSPDSKAWVSIVNPEDGLSMMKQREMAQFIAHMVNAGYKVILMTHSCVILDEIGLLMTLAQKRQRIKEILASQSSGRKNSLLDYRRVAGYGVVDRVIIERKVTQTGIDFKEVDCACHNPM